MYTPKEKIRVVIGTSRYRIEGDVHILAGGRLTDLVNVKAKDFWAVTNAIIRDATDEKVLYRIAYGVIARDEIIFLFPIEEQQGRETAGGPGPVAPPTTQGV